MFRNHKSAGLFVLLLLVASAIPVTFAEIPPLDTATFPAGTYVIPMDEKQAALAPGDVKVFGFIWALLNDGVDIYRIIQPPNVTLNTTTNPSGAVYSGGVIFVMEAYGANITAQQATFSTVIVDNLTEPFTSNNVFVVDEPTKILVIDGLWGFTYVTLDWMGIPYTKVSKATVEANATILLDYDLVVDDCWGWYNQMGGSIIPPAVANNMRTMVSNGGELIFTDIALLDLVTVFPGYVSVAGPSSGAWLGNVQIHNPPLTNFSPEYPSQYPDNFSTTVKLYHPYGGYVVSGVSRPSDVRIVMDTSNYGGNYRILACYFPYGDGVVEGFAYHPQEQTVGYTGDNNSYVVSALLYGNKFVAAVPPPGPIWSSDDAGNEKNTFDTSDTLYATVPGTGQTVRLYVVADQSNWTNGDTLTDVSGDGYEELTLSTNDTEVVKLWDPPLTLGDYDIVEDINRNGVYDEGTDTVDSAILVGARVLSFPDETPPNITDVTQSPLADNVLPEDEVKVNATVTDDKSGVKQVILSYTTDNETWFIVNMTNLEGNIWNGTIPVFPYCTNVTYVITAEDNANNTATTEEMEYDLQYHVIPEFQPYTILPLFMALTIIAVTLTKRSKATAKTT